MTSTQHDGICGESQTFLPVYMNQDYSPPSWWFGDSVCGSGFCSAAGVCECDAGWSDLSSFIDAEGIRCDVNEIAIKLLWAYNLGFSAFKIWRSRQGIRDKAKQHQMLVERAKKHGETYTLWQNKGYLALLVALFVCQPGVWLVGLLHLASSDQRVGKTWAVSIFFLIAKLGFYLAAHFFQPQLLSNILRGAKGSLSRKIVRPVRLWGRINVFTACIVGALPLVPLVVSQVDLVIDQDALTQGIYSAYMAGIVFLMFLYGTQAFVILSRFNAAFSSNLTKQSDQYRQLKRRVTRFQRRAYTHAIFQAIVYTAYFASPFLVNKFDYFLPLSWLVFHIMTKELGVSTLAVERSSSSGKSPSPGPSTGQESPNAPSYSSSQPNNSRLSFATSPSMFTAKDESFAMTSPARSFDFAPLESPRALKPSI